MPNSPTYLLSKFDTEVRLLLLCTRLQLEATAIDPINQVIQMGVDWDRFLLLAQQHRVIPLVHKHLKKLKGIPPNISQTLQKSQQEIALKNLAHLAKLIKLLNLIEQHGLQAVPYKGPVSAQTIYGDLALRQFGDLDLIIRERDRDQFVDLLLANGYQLQSQVNAPLTSQLAYEYHWHFVSDDGFIVEIHWALTYKFMPFPLDIEQLWSRLETVSLGNITVRHLCAEDQLLILSMHGFKHLWSRLVWVCDIAELLRQSPALDWTKLLSQTHTLGCEHILLFGLAVAHELLNVPLPEQIQSHITYNPHVQSLLTRVDFDFLFAPDEYNATHIDQVVLAHLATIESWPEKIAHFFIYLRYLFIRIVPPSEKDKAFMPLPAVLSFLYYLIRPIRLIKIFYLKSIKTK